MNPLTLVKRIQNINKREATLGISEEASWHAKYKDSAYVYVGGIPFDLTEGDVLAIFAQYGEIVDVNLIRDKGTGKSKGFAFLAYEDQRSTNLAVDNLNGAQVSGRIIRVDHVTKYKKLEEEDEETRQQKREERGVCRAFQRGECQRGDGCKFSHDEQRAANTGWGAKEDGPSQWGKDKSQVTKKDAGTRKLNDKPGFSRDGSRNSDKDSQYSRPKGDEDDRDRSSRKSGFHGSEQERRVAKRQMEQRDERSRSKYDDERSRSKYDDERSRSKHNDERSRKRDIESYQREEKYDRERDGRHRRRDQRD